MCYFKMQMCLFEKCNYVIWKPKCAFLKPASNSISQRLIQTQIGLMNVNSTFFTFGRLNCCKSMTCVSVTLSQNMPALLTIRLLRDLRLEGNRCPTCTPVACDFRIFLVSPNTFDTVTDDTSCRVENIFQNAGSQESYTVCRYLLYVLCICANTKQ